MSTETSSDLIEGAGGARSEPPARTSRTAPTRAGLDCSACGACPRNPRLKSGRVVDTARERELERRWSPSNKRRMLLLLPERSLPSVLEHARAGRDPGPGACPEDRRAVDQRSRVR